MVSAAVDETGCDAYPGEVAAHRPAPGALHALRQHLQELTSALDDTIRFEARERWKHLQRLLYVAGVVQNWRERAGLLPRAFLGNADECACEYAEGD